MNYWLLALGVLIVSFCVYVFDSSLKKNNNLLKVELPYKDNEITLTESNDIVGFELHEIIKTMSTPIYTKVWELNIPLTSSKPVENQKFMTSVYEFKSNGDYKLLPTSENVYESVTYITNRNYEKIIKDIKMTITDVAIKNKLIASIENSRNDLVIKKIYLKDCFLLVSKNKGYYGKKRQDVLSACFQNDGGIIFSIVGFFCILMGFVV